MRRILTLLLSLMLLCGCAAQQNTGTQPATQPATEALPVAEGLQDLTNETVRAVSPRQLSAMEDGLLLSNAEGRLVKLDWQELRVVADVTLEISDLAYVQALDRAVGISDPGRGTVTLLNQDLKVEQVIPCDADTKTWMLKRDGSEVYTLSSQGIRAHELATGAERELLHCRTLSILFLSGESVLLGAVGTEDLMSRYYVLDLTTGTLAEPTGARLEAIRKGLSPQQDGGYLLVDREKAVCYDEQGRFRDSCAHPGEGIGPSPFLWSDARQGWFVLEYGREGSRLLFWEPADGAEGEDLDLSPEVIPEGSILPRELYDRAAELSERFDLDIRIADQAVRDYTGYDSELLTDPEVTAQALDELERVLKRYPEGFFTQLKYGDRHVVRIELVDSLSGKEGHDVSSGTSAFTVRRPGYCMIVLNARRIRESVVFHEFSHVIDDRMAYEARLRPEAMYSEEAWLSLQPEGFAYADSYQNIGEEVTKFYDSGYFGSNYACVSATEDRAVTMEKACMADRAVFDANPHLMAKLEYYCSCIRDSFDTSGWPETLPWEQLLSD